MQDNPPVTGDSFHWAADVDGAIVLVTEERLPEDESHVLQQGSIFVNIDDLKTMTTGNCLVVC